VKVVAIILAGGEGSRFGGNYPKQFIKVAGKMIIEHTIDIFQMHAKIDEVLIVSKKEYAEWVLDIVNRNKYSKVIGVINGGVTRCDSTMTAIKSLDEYDEGTKVLFHDAVRPLLSDDIISECIDSLDCESAVDVVIPSADTLVEVSDDGYLQAIPNRNILRRGQTPQAFRLGVIKRAYEKIDQISVPITCDCGVLHHALPDVRIKVIAGEATNIKITEPIDVFLADKMFQSRGDTIRVENPSSICEESIRGRVLVIFGGSSGIGLGIAKHAGELGAHVYSFSRKTTGTDVVRANDVKSVLEKVYQLEKRIDYVINTAAVMRVKSLENMAEDEYEEIIAVNIRGAMNVAKYSLKYLAETRGCVLLFTSSSYTRGRAYYSVYSATKAAIVNLTQALAEEWLEQRVRINCINPERTDTPLRTKNFGNESKEKLLSVDQVALASLKVLVSDKTGHVVDVRKSMTATQNKDR